MFRIEIRSYVFYIVPWCPRNHHEEFEIEKDKLGKSTILYGNNGRMNMLTNLKYRKDLILIS